MLHGVFSVTTFNKNTLFMKDYVFDWNAKSGIIKKSKSSLKYNFENNVNCY